MKESKSEPVSDWQNTQYANLVRYVPSGKFFARLRVQGKLFRKSLKTDKITVAKLRLADLEKDLRHTAETQQGPAGKMTVADGLNIFRQRLAGDASLKPGTRDYYDADVGDECHLTLHGDDAVPVHVREEFDGWLLQIQRRCCSTKRTVVTTSTSVFVSTPLCDGMMECQVIRANLSLQVGAPIQMRNGDLLVTAQSSR